MRKILIMVFLVFILVGISVKTDCYAAFIDGSGGISTIHQDKVPHINSSGKVINTYDPNNSFFPLILYWTDIGPVNVAGQRPIIIQNTIEPGIGMTIGNNQTYFKGGIDDVKIFNRVLSETEIAAVKNGSNHSNLLSSWTFDDDQNPGKDSVGGSDVTLAGTVQISGPAGFARQFNGASDYLKVSNLNLFNFSADQGFSITAWVKYPSGDQSGVFRTIFSKIEPTSRARGYLFRLDNSGWGLGRLGFVFAEDGNMPKYFWVSGKTRSLNDDQWHHVAATYDGTQNISGIKLYIDGTNEQVNVIDKVDGPKGQAWNQIVPTLPNGADPNQYLRNSLPEVKTANFNTILHLYRHPANIYELDFVNSYGLKLVYQMDLIGHDQASVARATNLAKDHPATLMYHLFDENNLWWGATARNTIKSIDPERVIFANEDSNSRSNCLFDSISDITNVDLYPIGGGPANHLQVIVDRMKSYVSCSGSARKPVFQILQTFGPESIFALPTVPQVRNMAYGSIVGGVTGLWYFLQNGGNFTGIKKYTEDNQGISPEMDILRGQAHWAEVTKINNEISTNKKVFLSKTATDQYSVEFDRGNQSVSACSIITDPNSCQSTPQCYMTQYNGCKNRTYSDTPINTILKDTGEAGVRYLLSVNVDPFPVAGRFNFPWKTITNVTSVFDNRNVGFSGGSFTDPFTSYGVTLYRIQDSSYVPSTTNTPTPTPNCTLKPRGDVNCTGKIDIYDYNIFLGVFGQTGTPGWISSDLRVDGKIDIYDYSILLGNFGAQI